MFSGYNPLQLQAVRLDALGGDLRHRGRALRAAGRHHQPERDVARELDRDRDLDRGRRPRHADRRRSLGALLVNGGKSWFTRRFPSSGCSSSGALFVVVTLFLPHGIVGLAKLLAQARAAWPMPRRRRPCRSTTPLESRSRDRRRARTRRSRTRDRTRRSAAASRHAML